MITNTLRFSSMIFLLLALFTITGQASSSVNNNTNVDIPYNNGTNSTKNQELIFKTPDQLKNESSKLEYKSTIALPTDSSWSLVNQQEPTTQFSPKLLKKDDSNFLSFLSTNQFPSSTVKVVIDKIDVTDVDSRFYRIPNIKSEANNDYVYVTKLNSSLNYRPSAQEIAEYNNNSNKSNTIYLTNIDGKYTQTTPEEKDYQLAMIQEKVGNNDWSFSKPLSINLTSNSPQNQTEADNIVRKSNFDNQDYALKAPNVEAASNNNSTATSSNTQSQNTASNSTSLPQLPNLTGPDSNIIPWIATISGFGILNFAIRQYFKKQ